jgi:activator of HSP90 ATPase
MRTKSASTLTVLAGVIGLGVVGIAQSAPADETAADAATISHNAAAIHQEATFHSRCAAVYRALTDAQQFAAVTRLSDAASLLTAANAQATVISLQVGGAVALFGGYVTGRQLQMVPGVRLVQAWRAGSWGPSEFSIVRFELQAQGSDCHLTFDQRGFPESQAASLAYGWRVHYWEPLAKFLQH